MENKSVKFIRNIFSKGIFFWFENRSPSDEGTGNLYRNAVIFKK